MQNIISKPGNSVVASLFLLFFFALTLSAQAATVKWNGGGADNLVSNTANWAGGVIPHDNDAVVFDGTSTKDSAWDSFLMPASLSLNQGYTGTVTLSTDLAVTGSLVISGGTLAIKEGVLWVGGIAGTVPISLLIDSPSSGATIYRADTIVTGTVTDAGGYETGVTVNGVVANVYGERFVANHVPLQEGPNTITAAGTNARGGTSTASVEVNAVTTGRYIRLTADSESGVAPLATTLRVDGTFSIVASTLNATGPAQPQIVALGVDQYQVTMTAEGTYYFTASITGPDENLYQDTIGIEVLNFTAFDNLLRSKWNAMTTSLGNKDITTALTYISSGTRSIYQQMYAAIIDQLPALVATQTGLNLGYINGNVAVYDLITVENGVECSYEVRFVKDTNGLWIIQDF
jgi:hypothetical protein